MPVTETPLLRPHTRVGRIIVAVAASLFAALLIVAWSPALADDAQAAPAEGPYFHVASDSPELDRLPLKSTQVQARIVGPIADVTVTQRYRNEGQRPIEARYVFPGSTQAALGAGGFNPVSSDEVDEFRAGDQRLARVMSNPDAAGHEVIDLRLLRPLAMRGLESWNPDLIRTIHGYDAVVIWKGGHASSGLSGSGGGTAR